MTNTHFVQNLDASDKVLNDMTYVNSVTGNFFTGLTKQNEFNNKLTDGFVALSAQVSAGNNFLARAINRTAHGLAVGDWVRETGGSDSGTGTYVKAQADTESNALVLGVVGLVTDADNFTLIIDGYFSAIGSLTTSTLYYLSPTTAGAITSTKPTTSGQVIKPVCFNVGSSGRVYIKISYDSIVVP